MEHPRTDHACIDHPRIEREEIIDRYLAGRLPAEDEASFEEHLFACSACLEKVKWGEELRRGLQAVAAEDAARTMSSITLAAWIRSRRPAARAVLAAATLLVAALPVALLWQQGELGRLRQQVLSAAGPAVPTGDFRLVSLGALRSSGLGTGAAPTVEIAANDRRHVLLSLELPTVDSDSYRVTLLDAAGEPIWRGDALQPTLYDSLLVNLPPSFLGSGDYRIEIEALSPDGADPVAEMAFTVVAGKE